MSDCPFAIMKVPQRKKPCLFWKERENSFVKIASFNNEEARDIFIEYLNRWMCEIANEAMERVINND